MFILKIWPFSRTTSVPQFTLPVSGQWKPTAMEDKYVSTTDEILGFSKDQLSGLGPVHASIVRSSNIIQEFTGDNWFYIFGGKSKGRIKLVNKIIVELLENLKEGAKSKGADGIVGLRFSTTQGSGNFYELIASGTAVKLNPDTPHTKSRFEPAFHNNRIHEVMNELKVSNPDTCLTPNTAPPEPQSPAAL